MECLRDTRGNSANMPDLSTFHSTHCSSTLCLCSGTRIDHNCTTAVHLTRDLHHMRWMLENGADVEVEDVEGQRPIHYAVSDGPVELVELLIQHGANIDAADINGNRPLHYAARYGLIDVVPLLIKHGAKMNVQNIVGKTPLHIAVKCKQSDVILFLLKEGADVSLTDFWRNTPLHYVTSEQLTYDEVAECIITQTKKCQHLLIRNAFGITALSHMAAHGILDYLSDRNRCCIMTLVAELVFVDCNGNTPLHRVVGVYEHLKIYSDSSDVAKTVEFMLKRGADINAQNNDGLTPLHVACGKPAMEACLQCANDQSFTTVDKRGRNFWHLLFLSLNKDIFGLANTPDTIWPMISASDSKYNDDDLCRTPLHYACMSRNIYEENELHEEFIDKCSKKHIDKRDKFGKTALHYAVMKRNFDLMESLRSKKADDTLRDNFEKSAYEYMDNRSLTAVHSLLLQFPRIFLNDEFYSTSVCVCQCFFDQTHIAESSKAKLRRHKIGASDVLSMFYGCRADYYDVVRDKTMSMIGLREIWERVFDRMPSSTLFECYSLDILTNDKVSTTSVQSPTMFAAIQSEVDKAMDYLAKEISAKDGRFACEIFHVGSAYEGTKIGCCGEFDFNFVLTDVSKSCTVCYSPESPPGFVLLKASTPSYDEELFNNNGTLNTRIVKFKFETLVNQVLSLFSFCVNTGFEFFDSCENPLEFLPTSSKVNMRIKLAFTTPVNGCHVPHDISVDVVPTLRVDDWWPEEIHKKKLCQSGECMIVFTQPQNKYSWIGWTEPHGFISFARAESRLLRNCPNVIKAAFMIVKCMCMQLNLKRQLFSSHVIKTALL